MKSKNIFLGSIVALMSFFLIIYVIENDRSLLQVFVGFMIFVIPIMFISSFQTTPSAFLLVLFTAFIAYGIIKFEYYDVLLGILLAAIIGGSISYFRVEKYKIFSPSDYKKKAIESIEED